MAVRALALDRPQPPRWMKLLDLHWLLLLCIFAVASIGFTMLYSVAGGSLAPCASRQMVRFGVGLAILIAFAMIYMLAWLAVADPF